MTSNKLSRLEETDGLKLDSERTKVFKKSRRFMEEINETFDKQLDEIYIDYIVENCIHDVTLMNILKRFVEFQKIKLR